MAHWRLFYHFIWTTKNREPLLTQDIEPNVYRFLHAEADKMHVPLFVTGGTADHVHILAAVRPAVSPADFMKQLKGSSSRFISLEFRRPFQWQEGYGVFSILSKMCPTLSNTLKDRNIITPKPLSSTNGNRPTTGM
jgi:putative transposase